MKNSDKMTNAKALQFVLTNVEGLPSDVMEKLEKMLEQVEKKSTNRKPTAAQEARAGLLIEVANFMTAGSTCAGKGCSKAPRPLVLSACRVPAERTCKEWFALQGQEERKHCVQCQTD